MKNIFLFSVIILSSLFACQQKESTEVDLLLNPAASGFNAEQSDAVAIQIADQVMAANGGRQAWDETRYLRWNFFGNRRWYWDKHSGDIRVEIPEDTTVILYNLDSGEGRVWMNDQEWEHPDTLERYFKLANNGWINDSYWLFMPFKLKDSGVTLKYIGVDTLPGGSGAHVLELTFAEVGVTPENKYHVWVDSTAHLVRQWAFFANNEDEEARFITPWDNYQKYGNIKLSSSRGGSYEISEIAVLSDVDSMMFRFLNPSIWIIPEADQ